MASLPPPNNRRQAEPLPPQSVYEAPFEFDEPAVPGHLQLCVVWLPHEAGWSAMFEARSWPKFLAIGRKKMPTTAARSQQWVQVLCVLRDGYEANLERYGAEGGVDLALTAGVAACLRPGSGKLLRLQLQDALRGRHGGARLVVVVSEDRQYALTTVQGASGQTVQ